MQRIGQDNILLLERFKKIEMTGDPGNLVQSASLKCETNEAQTPANKIVYGVILSTQISKRSFESKDNLKCLSRSSIYE